MWKSFSRILIWIKGRDLCFKKQILKLAFLIFIDLSWLRKNFWAEKKFESTYEVPYRGETACLYILWETICEEERIDATLEDAYSLKIILVWAMSEDFLEKRTFRACTDPHRDKTSYLWTVWCVFHLKIKFNSPFKNS